VDEWRRGITGWHAVFVMLAAVTAVAFLLDEDRAPQVPLVVLAVLGGWYLGVGAKALRAEQTRRGLLYIAGAAPLTVVLFALSPVGSIMLFALYPHMWALLPPRHAITGTAVVIAAVSTVIVAAESLGFAVIFGGSSLVVAVLLGLWITRIIDQSRHRAYLVVTERQRLAREIHDTLAQGFAAMLLQLEAIETQIGPNEHVTKARRVARDNLAEARALVDALAPPDLRASTLAEALQRITEAQNARFALTGRPKALPATHEVMLLRAVQEALANTGKHAQARRTEVELHYGDCVRLVVSDDGVGFDPAIASSGFGLKAMRSRAAETGAVLTIVSTPGTGTRLSLEIPA
jgi:signal transduction histidine kinase